MQKVVLRNTIFHDLQTLFGFYFAFCFLKNKQHNDFSRKIEIDRYHFSFFVFWSHKIKRSIRGKDPHKKKKIAFKLR